MDRKTLASFNNHEDWLSYVRREIPITEQPYALACGRTELFKRFYETRKRIFPSEFVTQLELIRALSEPHRTQNLESLNERIFVNLRMLLFNQADPKAIEAENVSAMSPREQVADLLDYLEKNNPYFSLQGECRESASLTSDGETRVGYVDGKNDAADEDETAFALAMEELNRLLVYFQDKNLPLPRYFSERALFLHRLRGPERMLQTRALLNTLTAEMEACTSA